MGIVHAHEGKSHHLVRGKADLAEGTRGSGCHAAKKPLQQKMSVHVGDGGAAAAQGDLCHDAALPRKEITLTYPNAWQGAADMQTFLCLSKEKCDILAQE